ncbi:CST complex subunit Ten1 [Aspergillus karnatakaensis]|uniref:nuclear telomere cap complex subunit Ten1 n=1 Tax=Aspergillus karnatakaensis TaxID=1810916 RepID=UPI003CCCB80A
MNGPLPSSRVFLSDVPSLPIDSKVRFMGCITKYDILTGTLILEHNYPRVKKSRQEPWSIVVDINAVLESVTWEELCVGAWINVVGYVRRVSAAAWAHKALSAPDAVQVDAVVIFPAGGVDLSEYERILCNSQEVERMRRSVG